MSLYRVISVQLGNCTDEFATNQNIFPSKTAHGPLQTNYLYRSTHLEGLADRALHPLWQTRMQMRKYSRARPQILFVGQLHGSQTRTGICASEGPSTGRRVTHQLSDDQADLRRNIEHQSRTAATQKRVVIHAHGYRSGLLYVVRNRCLCNPRSEYASAAVGRFIGRNRHMGGNR